MSAAISGIEGKDVDLPLAGIRITDVSHIVAGPFCGAILADFGAEVIKVEPPGKGDRARDVAPFVECGEARVSGFFATVNRNRRGVVLDLKSGPGKETFRKLVAVSDVLIENFAPGTMQRLGLGYEVLREINPRLIYVAISGFGQLAPYVGPWSSRPANNATAQAMSGLMDLSGDPDGPPAFIGQAIGDTIPALWAVIGTLLALEHRRRTGLGQFIDVAMYDSLASMCFNAISDYHVSGVGPGRGMAWRETFSDRLKCADGYIAVSLWGTVRERWQRLWPLIDHPEMLTHPDFDPAHPGCPTCFPIVKSVLEKWLAETTRADAVRLLLDLGFSAGPVQTVKEVYESEQLQQRQLFIEIEDGLGGVIRTVGTPVKFSGFRTHAPRRAPYLGEHTRKVLTGLLGLSEAEIDRLGLGSETPA
jgi:crotonobetainyl-CoA:carnitine CoA-transferase CaiB-like acyl-CoA transferase